MSEPAVIELKDGRRWIVHDGVLFGADVEVATWTQATLDGGVVQTLFTALGILQPGVRPEQINEDTVMTVLAGGAIFFNHHHEDGCSDITVTVANYDERTGHPSVIRRVLAYPFQQLKVRRITAEIHAGNERSIRNATALGFREEGRKRRAGPNGTDIVIMGLLPDECAIWKDEAA